MNINGSVLDVSFYLADFTVLDLFYLWPTLSLDVVKILDKSTCFSLSKCFCSLKESLY